MPQRYELTNTAGYSFYLSPRTQVPLFAILLFGGPISINHIAGGLTVTGPSGAGRVRMKAWPRIGVLVNQLRSVK